MTFKANWEKVDQKIQLPVQTIESMVKMAFPNKKISSYKIISGGCANLNIQINLEPDNTLYILRVYLRDKEAAYREKNLGLLLKKPFQYHMFILLGIMIIIALQSRNTSTELPSVICYWVINPTT